MFIILSVHEVAVVILTYLASDAKFGWYKSLPPDIKAKVSCPNITPFPELMYDSTTEADLVVKSLAPLQSQAPKNTTS